MLYWQVTYWYSSTCTWSHLCDAFRASILFELGNFIMLERWYTTLLTNFIGTTFYSKCMLCRVFGGNWSPFSIHWRLRRCIIEKNATKWTRQHARIVFHQKSSSTDDAWCMMHDAWCNTLVDLIFVRTVSIPNLSLLPCFEVA